MAYSGIAIGYVANHFVGGARSEFVGFSYEVNPANIFAKKIAALVIFNIETIRENTVGRDASCLDLFRDRECVPQIKCVQKRVKLSSPAETYVVYWNR